MIARILIAAVVVSIALAGCASIERGTGSATAGATKKCMSVADPCGVKVSVSGGRIGVDYDIVEVGPGVQPIIVWTLADDTYNAGYRFDSTKGIDLSKAAPGIFNCRSHAADKVFFCTNTPRGPGKYKYDINLVAGPSGPLTLDPYIINN
jgi:hypothetical protein